MALIKTTNLGLMKWVLNSVFEGGWLSRQTLYRSRTSVSRRWDAVVGVQSFYDADDCLPPTAACREPSRVLNVSY